MTYSGSLFPAVALRSTLTFAITELSSSGRRAVSMGLLSRALCSACRAMRGLPAFVFCLPTLLRMQVACTCWLTIRPSFSCFPTRLLAAAMFSLRRTLVAAVAGGLAGRQRRLFVWFLDSFGTGAMVEAAAHHPRQLSAGRAQLLFPDSDRSLMKV